MEIALCERKTHACSESVKTETGVYVCRHDFFLTSNMKCDCPDKRMVKLASQQAELKQIVDEQAEDDGLWFIAATAPEAYLQKELRRLHAKIERVAKCGARLGIRGES